MPDHAHWLFRHGIAGLIIFGSLFAIPVHAQSLDLARASQLIAGAMQYATKNRLAVSIVVVDAGGHFVCGARMDGAPFGTFDVARGKAAATAATGGASGAELVKRYQANPIVK